MEHVGAVGTRVAETVGCPHIVEDRLWLVLSSLHLPEEIHRGNNVCVSLGIECGFIGVGQGVKFFKTAEADDGCSREVTKEVESI